MLVPTLPRVPNITSLFGSLVRLPAGCKLAKMGVNVANLLGVSLVDPLSIQSRGEERSFNKSTSNAEQRLITLQNTNLSLYQI